MVPATPSRWSAGDRARAVLDPMGVDRDRARAALADLPPPGGSADLPDALGEAFRILDQQGRNANAEIVVLTDGARAPWHSSDRGRWQLLRDLRDRLPAPPRIRVASFPVVTDPGSSDGRVDDLRSSRRLVAPGGTIGVSASVRNLGPSSLERSVELLLDGVPVPGSTRAVGPIPEGGSMPVEFRESMTDLGSHAVTVRLAPGGTPDPLPGNDEAAIVVEVAEALPVLLVDGEPGLEPMTGEVDFLRAALMPRGEAAPQVRATVIAPDALNNEALSEHRVLVLANVDRLTAEQLDDVSGFLARGGGVLVLPGDRTLPDPWNRDAFRDGRGWLPSKLGVIRGRFGDRQPIARPSPSSFSGPALGPLGTGAGPPLGSAMLFAAFDLEPAEDDPSASVLARLDSGSPWLVERPEGEGRVAMLAGPLDAEGGTLPANPDFVPFVHELIFRLADPDPDASSSRPGEPLSVPFVVDPDPAEAVASVPVRTPSGRVVTAVVERSEDGEGAIARLVEADEAGLYRFELPGGAAYRLVTSDDDGSADDPAPLSVSDRESLAEGWPLAFDVDPDPTLDPAAIDRTPGRSTRPLWRTVLLAALAGLCLEVWLTRRLALRRGPAALANS